MKSMKKNTASLSGALKNVFALGLVSFFADISSEMVFSILPVFILDLPGGSASLLGVIEGVAEALSYGLRAVSGFFSDRYRKRKAIVFVGYALSSIIKPFFAVVQTALQAFAVRVTERIGKAIRTPPRDALLSDIVSEKHRGAAFGLHRTLDQAGAIIGPLTTSALLLLLGLTMRTVFWVSLIPGLIALLILLLLVEERVGRTSTQFEFLPGVREVAKGRFLWLLLIVGLFSLGAFDFSFILLNAKQSGLSDSLVPLVYALINLAHTLAAIPAGLLSDKIGKEKVLIIGYAVFLGALLLIFAMPKTVSYAYLVAVIFGLYVGIVETIQRALVPTYAASSVRGTAYGLYYLVVGIAFLAANIIVGFLWQYSGSSSAVSYSIFLSSVAIISMLLFVGYHKRVKQ